MRNIVLGALTAIAGSLAGPAFAVTLNVATYGEEVATFPVGFPGWDEFAMADCLEGLVAEDVRGNAMPGQAQSWTISPDGMTYRFTLRPGILWSDGNAVTAQDFVTAFRWLFDPSNAVEFASIQFPIQNAQAVAKGSMAPDALGVMAADPQTLEIRLDYPTPYFLQTLTHYSAFPVPTDKFKRLGRDWLKPENIVCNGPFVIAGHEPGVMRLERSATYYGREAVRLDGVNYHSYADLQAGLDAFGRGEIDLFMDVPHAATPWIRAHTDAALDVEPFLGVYFYALNHDKPPFDDVRVRMALSMAVDRDAIDPFDLRTPALSSYSWVPAGTAGYGSEPLPRPQWADWNMDERLARAKELLAESGHGPGNPLTVEMRYSQAGDDLHQRIAVAMSDMWARIGVRTRLVPVALDEHFNALRSGDFDVGRVTWLLDVPDPSNVLQLFRSDSEYNFGRYRSETYDALLDAASAEGDSAERATILHQAEQTAIDDVAAIPIYWSSIQNLIAPDVNCVVANPKNIHRARWISKGASDAEAC
ncbi:peptide ABC transporter substrate-binding protein [Paradevosia shaoguanensis]|uniref:Peptide ABC transporter substrate-binding protein n=1 Tax=Paradevosia shaoguanensis TaxID=1335043 RepID=A0AA41QIS8_9HYPH|nr:peptide ABC transporter substrate-binding protein [Paradevosia shaoguanensis]MCI0125587.1 peptide ABC transporter substrate-binding protein [Paradevosia shaoguanensis]